MITSLSQYTSWCLFDCVIFLFLIGLCVSLDQVDWTPCEEKSGPPVLCLFISTSPPSCLYNKEIIQMMVVWSSVFKSLFLLGIHGGRSGENRRTNGRWCGREFGLALRNKVTGQVTATNCD